MLRHKCQSGEKKSQHNLWNLYLNLTLALNITRGVSYSLQ
jgi:hypothetical protein